MSRKKSLRVLAFVAAVVPASFAFSYTFINVGDTPFQPWEINQSMTDYPTATGQHNSFYSGAASRWQSFTPTLTKFIGASFMTTTATNGDTVSSTNPHSFTIDLYAGEGISGSLLGSKTITGVWQGPKEGNVIWAFARFDNPIAVVPGQKYTIKVTDLNPGTAASANRIQWSVRTTDYYSGGRNDAGATWDYVFKAAVVPEPSTVVLVGTGIVALLRRKRS